MKIYLILSLLPLQLLAQDCDCTRNYQWVKTTFEQNDAGYAYALQSKGNQAYEDHNKRIEARIQKAKTLEECTPILYEWMQFFRSGHISIRNVKASNATAPAQDFSDWETQALDEKAFRSQLLKKVEPDFEGIWHTDPYTIAIKRFDEEYKGVILTSGADTWTPGQVKLRFTVHPDKAVYYMRDHSPVTGDKITLEGKNTLRIGTFVLTRTFPEYQDEADLQQYFRSIGAKVPFMESLNQNTLYMRIPSFNSESKRAIDSVLAANKAKILRTKNLILDIRSGTGGSDESFYGLMPYLYTNPVRTVGVEYRSTVLNNQRMLDFINKPEYGFDEAGKKWAKTSYEKLQAKLGEWVSLNTYPVSVDRQDTVYTYPQNVAIIINKGNGSTDEQFLLAAKQSRKVKLYGTTTHGVLDISNMYFVPSPCGEFEMGYALSRSMRIPDFTIDEIGIQPDYFLDRTLPESQWTKHVSEILNGK
jgi:hypothetical protein